MAVAKKKTAQDVLQEKAESLMNGVAYWAAFYRCNPQRFVADYLNIQLKLFQKILIYIMIVSTHFAYFAARGLKGDLLDNYQPLFFILRKNKKEEYL